MQISQVIQKYQGLGKMYMRITQNFHNQTSHKVKVQKKKNPHRNIVNIREKYYRGMWGLTFYQITP
jgi:hypothetical protein